MPPPPILKSQETIEAAIQLCRLACSASADNLFCQHIESMKRNVLAFLAKLERHFEEDDGAWEYPYRHDFYKKESAGRDANPGTLLRVLLKEAEEVDYEGGMNVLFVIAMAIANRGCWIDEAVTCEETHQQFMNDLYVVLQAEPPNNLDASVSLRLQELSYCVVARLLKPMAQNFSLVSSSSDSPAVPVYDHSNQDTQPAIEHSEHRRNQRRAQILRRDGYRCCITKMKMVDTTPAVSSRRQFHSFNANLLNTGTAAVAVEIAHIIPHSFNAVSTEDPRMSVWSIMNIISPRISDHLLGNNINHPGNLITLDANIHKRFGALMLGLEPCHYPPALSYKLVTRDQVNIDTTHPEVCFVNSTGEIYITIPDHSGEDIPLPDPHLLRIHLACVKVAYLSGHAEAIDRILSDDEGGVLAWDGSTDIGLILATRMDQRGYC